MLLVRRAASVARARAMSALSHVDASTGLPTMVDVSDKAVTTRTASAEGFVQLPRVVVEHLRAHGGHTGKGPVFATAVIAGTSAVKETWRMIPMCHAIPISGCKVTLDLDEARARVRVGCWVRTDGKTGVEMEALTGVSVAALTVYDMCKALSHEITIDGVRLVAKDGGRSGSVRPFASASP